MDTKQGNKSNKWRNTSPKGEENIVEEKCLITETQKLRKYGSIQDSNQQENIQMDTIINLEKELKFWQREAEKLSHIIEINDKKQQLVGPKCLLSKKKNSKEIKRHDKVIKRSHSVETSQRKLKECEFEKLRMEKLQMKNLLNDLERQVVEIQSNVLKISDERQRYKELYYKLRDKLEENENINVNMERTICDLSNENAKMSCEGNKLSDELEIVTKDNAQLKLSNQNLLKEITQKKVQHEHEIKHFESKLSSLVKENHDIGVRSNNLKGSIVSLEEDFKTMEQELKNKCVHITDQSNKISSLESELNTLKKQFEEKSDCLNNVQRKLSSVEENNLKLRKTEELITEKLDKKYKEINQLNKREKDKDEIINNMKISFSANAVKLENHLQKAEQMLTSKIKLITSLELKVFTLDKELKLREEDILLLKKTLNTKEHESEIMVHKYEEVNERKRYLEQQLENVNTNYEDSGHEITCLNEVIKEMKRNEEFTRSELKSLKEDLNRKEDQMLVLESQIERYNKDIPVKNEEISRNKKVISQLQNEIEKKESHIGSLLSLLEGKEEKILSLQSNYDHQERKVNEYEEQLRNCDDSTIQFTARNNALEEEIEIINNNNMRLSRQKEHLSQMLSSRNKTIGQLQAQLADKNEKQYLERIPFTESFQDKNDFKEDNYSQRKSKRNGNDITPENDRLENIINRNQQTREQIHFIPIRLPESLSDNYDPKALRSRTQSHNGRISSITNAA